jgi:hypothetical protein
LTPTWKIFEPPNKIRVSASREIMAFLEDDFEEEGFKFSAQTRNFSRITVQCAKCGGLRQGEAVS